MSRHTSQESTLSAAHCATTSLDTARERATPRTLVVKIGTSTLLREGSVDEEYLDELGAQLAQLAAQGWRTVVVSSGAVRCGLNLIGLERAANLTEKQAAAAIGQSLLMRAYRVAFARHDLTVAQMLLTRSDTADRRRFLNARHTCDQLFRWGVVPIVNENDTVSTDEIRVGDNDTLAALTALLAGADLLLLLSDVTGFFLPGQAEPEARIEIITPEIEAAAGGAGSVGGTGGMRTKLEAARIATQAGIDMVIARGREAGIVTRVATGESLGTRFCAQPGRPARARKSWIAHGGTPLGTLHLHPRARAALLESGASLLPVGIERVEGEFGIGALVSLRDEGGEIGRGIVNFASGTLREIAGLQSKQWRARQGDSSVSGAPKVAVHRDNFLPTAPREPAPTSPNTTPRRGSGSPLTP